MDPIQAYRESSVFRLDGNICSSVESSPLACEIPEVYKKETLPVSNHYRNLNKYNEINGIGSIDDIFYNICSKIDK